MLFAGKKCKIFDAGADHLGWLDLGVALGKEENLSIFFSSLPFSRGLVVEVFFSVKKENFASWMCVSPMKDGDDVYREGCSSGRRGSHLIACR